MNHVVVSEGLRALLVACYGDVDALRAGTAAQRKRSTKIRALLAALAQLDAEKR